MKNLHAIVHLGWVCLLVLTAAASGAEPGAAKKTALDDYVAKADPAYSWKLVKAVKGDGVTTFILDLKSQTWRAAPEVDRAVWQHWLVVVRPDKVLHDTAYLRIGSGRNGGAAPGQPSPPSVQLAKATGTVVADLGQVPNQPLVFNGDGKPRSEDDLIAYCQIKYMDTGDPTWLPRLPMVKSAVRAMDAVGEFLASAEGGQVAVRKWVVAGGSKRGWTTWLTGAADPRVTAIVPIVIDVVNVRACKMNHYASYGFWAQAVGDYTRHKVHERFDTPQYAKLLQIVDPYFYRDRLKLPKFVVNSAGDQYFPPDSSKFYFDDLQGPKYLRYVPNTNHSLAGSDAADSILAFYRAVLKGLPLPKFSWKVQTDGSIRVHAETKPLEVNLWQATNPKARDFRLLSIGKAYTKSPLKGDGKGNYVARVEKPAAGWTAFFAELVFDSGDDKAPYKFTTPVHIVPDVLPHSFDDFRRGAAAESATPAVPAETPEEARRRHERVAARRKGVDIICHRGASEHAHENTLEAFRAAFELGADGNEFDIRATKDGVLVVFHDDMLDRLLEHAYGDVGDYTWAELQRFRFRSPGRFGEQCRIPTLVEVFDLHRKHGGLMHLDIKRPGLDKAIADLLTRMDLWDHVAYCNTETGGVILSDKRLKLRRYKAGLYLDRGEVFPDAVALALKKPGDGLIVDDLRGVAVALGRKLGKLSKEPVSPGPEAPREVVKLPDVAALIAALCQADDWDRVAEGEADKAASGRRIRARALAAERLLALGASSKEAFAALEERVRKRSLHKDWMYHGLDGAMALRSLLQLRAPNAVEAARFALWRDDPALEPVIDPRWKNPRAWTDFRVKMVIFPALASCPGAAAEKLCRDYLALSDEAARKLGPPQFEEAARALLAVSPKAETALELLKHRLRAVRGRAVLDCLGRANEEWAREALKKGAPFALAYRVED
jgi:PhoPQ-activated pathogenicity-related protein